MMRKSALAIGVAATAFAMPAMARDGAVYIGADAGVVVFDETDLEISSLPTTAEVDYQVGWELGGVLGYDWGPIRTELE
ncbi:MAG: flagellar motor protein MotB, partial [Alteraurantiacibacter sp.]